MENERGRLAFWAETMKRNPPKRECLRYDGSCYSTTLVCWCRRHIKIKIRAPYTQDGRPDVQEYADQMEAAIEESGWKHSVNEPFDTCPKCRKGKP